MPHLSRPPTKHALRVKQTKLKMKFIYFSIVLNTVVLEMNFTKKIENQIPNITQSPPMQATKKLMNSDNYYLHTQLMKFILRCLSLRNNLLSNESNVTHTQLLFFSYYMIMIVISFALVKFYAFAILYVLIVMQIKLVVVVYVFYRKG